MKTRKRGGKRLGAGRPPKFTLCEKLSIHGQCQKISNRLALEDADRRTGERFEGDEIEEGLEALMRLPLMDRRRVTALLESDGEPPEDTPLPIIEAYSEMASRRAALDRKGRGVRGTSYGQRSDILKEVAAWASQKFGREVTVNQIAEVLKDRNGDLNRVFSTSGDSPDRDE